MNSELVEATTPSPPFRAEMAPSHVQVYVQGFFSAMREDARFILALMVLGTLAYLFAYAGWPLIPGRDYSAYLEHYHGSGTGVAFFRPVGASYFLGWLFDLGRPGMVLAMLSVYLLFLLCAYMVGLAFSRTTARVVSLIMLFDFQVTVFFLKLDGDFSFCLATALWSVLMMRFFRMENPIGLFLLGLATFVPVIFRQTAILYILVVLFPLVCFGLSKKNLFKTIAVAAGFTMGLFCLLCYNQSAFGHFSFPYLSGYIPMKHVYRYGPGFSPEYGPENRKLLQLVERELLSKPVYVENGVGMKEFLEYRWDIRKFADLHYLGEVVDRGILFRASMESIFSRPGEFAKTVFSMILRMFVEEYRPPLPALSMPVPAVAEIQDAAVAVDARQSALPPSAPNPVNIPLSYSSTPDVLQHLNGTTTLEKERKSFSKEQWIKKSAEAERLFDAQGNYYAALVAKMVLTPVVPPMLVFLVASLLLPFVDRFRRRVRLLLIMLTAAFGLIVASVLVFQTPDYRLPLDFLIVLGGVVGVQYNPWIRKIFQKG